MWIFRVDEPRLGAIRIREWRRRARHTIGLLMLLPGISVTGLVILDQSSSSFPNKMLAAPGNGLNFVATPGSFSRFDREVDR
jgi:voltage-gated potassium channel